MLKEKTTPKLKYSKRISAPFFITAVVLLFIASETLFIIRNPNVNKSFKLKAYLLLTQRFAYSSNGPQALKYFIRASEIKASQNNFDHIKKEFYGEINNQNASLTKNSKLNDNISEYLSGLNYSLLETQLTSIWSKNLYNLGLLAYQNENKPLTGPLWYLSSLFFPELSYSWIELASFYAHEGEPEKAVEILKECSNYLDPQEHCSKYVNDLTSLDKPGSFKDLIQTIK